MTTDTTTDYSPAEIKAQHEAIWQREEADRTADAEAAAADLPARYADALMALFDALDASGLPIKTAADIWSKARAVKLAYADMEASTVAAS